MIKCLVWDLDETLWEGVLGENASVRLKPRADAVVQELDRRGILQSIASRNDSQAALEQLAELGLKDYFLYPQCHFGSKVSSIGTICHKLKILPEALAFIDDDPFEREQVRYYYPEIRSYEAEEYHKLLSYPEFAVEVLTKEGRERRHMILAEADRERAARLFQGDNRAFLRESALKLLIRPACGADLARVAEMVMRTNQFNTSLERMTEGVIRTYLEQERKLLYVAELKDRFGEYGIVGVVFLEEEKPKMVLRLFTVSCRIASRGIGRVFLAAVINRIQQQHREITFLEAPYRRGSHNNQILILLKMLGFHLREAYQPQQDLFIYRLPLPTAITQPEEVWVEWGG